MHNLEPTGHEQTAISPRHYHESVNPHDSNRGFNVLIVVFILAFLVLVLIGAITARAQLGEIGMVFFYGVVGLTPLCLTVLVGYLAFHKWYMDKQKRKQARLDAEAKEQQVNDESRLVQAEAAMRQAHAKRIEAEAERIRLLIPFDDQGNAAIRDPYTQQVIQLTGQMREHPGLHSLTTQYRYNDTSTRVTEEKQGQIGQGTGLALPNIEQFIKAIPFNSLQTGMGLDVVKKELVILPITRPPHFKIVGGSDTGKSCIAAAMLDIAIATNDPEHLQIGLLDLEYNTSRLFENVPHIAEIGPKRERLIGRDPNEVAFKLNLLYTELQRRERLGEDYVKKYLPVILVYIEELLALKYEVDKKLKGQLIENINIMGLRLRKYNIFLLAVMQADYSDKETREGMAQFRTRAGFALDPEVSRASGFINTPLIKENFLTGRQGQFVLEKPGYSGIVLAPDYDVRAKLALLSGSTTDTTTQAPLILTESHYKEPQIGSNQPGNSGSIVDSNFTTSSASQAGLEGLSEQDKRILRKLRTMTPSAVIASEFSDRNGKPLKSGNDFIEKTKYIQSLIARFLPVMEG